MLHRIKMVWKNADPKPKKEENNAPGAFKNFLVETKDKSLSASNFATTGIHAGIWVGIIYGVKYLVETYTDSGNPKKVFKR